MYLTEKGVNTAPPKLPMQRKREIMKAVEEKFSPAAVAKRESIRLTKQCDICFRNPACGISIYCSTCIQQIARLEDEDQSFPFILKVLGIAAMVLVALIAIFNIN